MGLGIYKMNIKTPTILCQF